MIQLPAAAVRIVCLLIGYGFGLIQTSYIYGKLHGVDIRESGSGNAGTTNALRTFGLKIGVLVMAVDILKGVAAVVLCRMLFAGGSHPASLLLGLYAGFGCILGHNFPFYMSFRGGKGVACTAAVALMFDWHFALIVIVEFFVIILTTHYVSLGSLVSMATFVILAILYGSVGGKYDFTSAQLAEAAILLILILTIAVWQHRGNLERLIRGCERKTYLFRKK